MKLTVLVFVLIAAGAAADKAEAPSQTEAHPLVVSIIKTNAGATAAHFSAGPTCIPHEPCGSGTSVI
jgi:hypothetical protein